jgi:Zn-finger nucleic acid-binding protein
MNCPKCSGIFVTQTFEDVEFDRCNNCNGLWFDILEKEDLVKIKGSESIDIGDEQVSLEYREMRSIDCPHCHQTMVPMIDKDQFHIKYESCQNCFGTFFDAGEFKDLKEHSVVERFNQLLQTLRTHL